MLPDATRLQALKALLDETGCPHARRAATALEAIEKQLDGADPIDEAAFFAAWQTVFGKHHTENRNGNSDIPARRKPNGTETHGGIAKRRKDRG